MSMSRSASIDSSASTATATTFSHVDLPVDSSNGLYEDREHFQAIFTNDSRFFDTSLHLFKSYYELGYISADEDKSNNLPVPTLSSATSRTSKHRWRPRLLRLHHDHPHDNHHGTIKGFLTPILLRRTGELLASRLSKTSVSLARTRSIERDAN